MRSLHAGTLLVLLSPLLGCGDQLVGWPDGDGPTVTSTVPLDLADDVQVDLSLHATFDQPMAPLTLSVDSFTVLRGHAEVAGVVTYSGFTATFNPDEPLDPDTVYTATVTDAATNVAGLGLDVDHVWTFTTAAGPDTVAPTVVETIPDAGATSVAVNTHLFAMFSEPMDPLTITTASFTLAAGIVPVTGAVSQVGGTAVFTFAPAVDLAPATLYTATITDAASDLTGDSLIADHVWTFTTAIDPDLDPGRPIVVVTWPEDDAIGVPLDTLVSATFNELMQPLSIDDDSFTLLDGLVPIEGLVTLVGTTATFTPVFELDPGTIYTATVTDDVSDLAGNTLLADHVWTFTTTVDPGLPEVILTQPEDGEIDVPVGTLVFATFSEPMDPLSLHEDSFTLSDDLGPIDGIVIAVGEIATFAPLLDLEPDTLYTATITDEATDLAGNALFADHVWTFTTGADLDGPTVIFTVPADLAIDVRVDDAVSATFSEELEVTSVTDLTFTVTDPDGVEVPGALEYDELTLTATFTPEDVLEFDTVYTGTLTTGIEDLLGNPLEADHVWTFTTEGFRLLPVDLRSLETFVAVAGAGLTNSQSGGITTLNGDVGLSPTGTCISDGVPCWPWHPVINGELHITNGIAAEAKVDLVAAYVDAMGRPPGTTVNDISEMTLVPGVYTSGSTMSVAVGGFVYLDAEGDPDAVWIFQVGSSLTVNNGAQIVLLNGAQSKNVFWGVFASSTLGSDVAFHGSILAGESNSVGTRSIVVGRLLCTTGEITLLSNYITLPL